MNLLLKFKIKLAHQNFGNSETILYLCHLNFSHLNKLNCVVREQREENGKRL